MPMQIEKIPTEKQLASDKFDRERAKMTNGMFRIMKRRSYKNNFVTGICAGGVMGIMMAMLLGYTAGRSPVRDEKGRVASYILDKEKATKAMIKIFAVSVLVCIIASMAQNTTDVRKNRNCADRLSHDVIKRSIEKALNNLGNVSLVPSETIITVAQLIISNMSDKELLRMRIMAQEGLKIDAHETYTINDVHINAATRIVTNCIENNPELWRNIAMILQGKEPATWFISRQQKTK